MTRRSRTSGSFENRLDALDEQHREPDPNDWRVLLDLPASASRADGWKAFLCDEGDNEAWRAYIASGWEDE